MPSLEERVAYLEGRLEYHVGAVDNIGGDVRDLRGQLERDMSGLRAHIGGSVSDLRTQIERDASGLRAHIDGNVSDLRTYTDRDLSELRAQIDRLDGKISRHFTWLVGIQIAVLVAIVGALLGR